MANTSGLGRVHAVQNAEFAQIAEIMSISHMMQYTNCGLPHSDIRMHVREDHMPP